MVICMWLPCSTIAVGCRSRRWRRVIIFRVEPRYTALLLCRHASSSILRDSSLKNRLAPHEARDDLFHHRRSARLCSYGMCLHCYDIWPSLFSLVFGRKIMGFVVDTISSVAEAHYGTNSRSGGTYLIHISLLSRPFPAPLRQPVL